MGHTNSSSPFDDTGQPCAGFGETGKVALREGIGEAESWEYYPTSPGYVIGDVIVLGALVADNVRVDAPSGVVRAWDARTGALRWAWDLSPPDATGLTRAAGTGYVLSTPNVWAPMAVDEARDLLFVPTGNPTPDYATAHRRGLDHYGSSIVALRASTGERVWYWELPR